MLHFLKHYLTNMDKLQLLKNGIDFAKQNPDSPQAIELRKRIESGMYANELNQLKQQSSVAYVAPKERSITEKIAGFTGGEKLAQGVATSISAPIVSKNLAETTKLQGEAQDRIIAQIQKNKAEGKDNTKLINALQELNKNQLDLAQGTEKLLNPEGLTGKQITGDALQLATTIAGAGTYGGATKNMTTGVIGKALPSVASEIVKGTGIVKGAIQGAKTGAIAGGAFGASSGVSSALKEDKSALDVAKSGLVGAGIGAGVGGAVGGITGGISGGIKKANLNKQNKYLEAITPNTKDLTPTEYEDLLNRGKITPKTTTTPSQYILSDVEKETAKKYKDLFTNDPVKNTQNILNEISKKDAEVSSFLDKNNKNFDVKKLKKFVSSSIKEISDVSIPESRIEKLKQTMIDKFVSGLDNNDVKTLWQARKEFDRQIEKSFSGSPTLQNNLKREFRNSIQDFIANETPDGIYKNAMKDMTQLFNLKDITNTKAVKEKGMNAIQLWIKRNPTKVKVLGFLTGTGVIAGTVKSLVK